ncbi:hypothetical protein Prudu_012916, partial [Prunus dulcis]
SAAKRVRRHGVDPNRGCNEEDMLISAVGTIESASVSPSRPDRPPPRGRPELAGKPCFPTEVSPKPSELPARNSPSFLHQIDRVRHRSPTGLQKRPSKGQSGKFWDWSKYMGDSAEISAEV